MLKRNNSSVLRQSVKRQSSCEELYKSMRQLQQTSVSTTSEAFVLPSDWLQQLQQQLKDGK